MSGNNFKALRIFASQTVPRNLDDTFTDLGVAAADGELVGGDWVEADGRHRLAAVDQHVLLAQILLAARLGPEVEPADGAVLATR